jgi:hypothetical protein
MGEDYDRERAAALVKAGRDITAHLKTETAIIKKQMERVLTGGAEEEAADAPGREEVAKHATVKEKARVGKTRWRFWR